jgi:Mg-chelatase subunit ChlD
VIGRRAAAFGLALCLAIPACSRDEAAVDRPSRTERRVDEALVPVATVPAREGLAAAIVIDVSGSMADSVAGEGGREEPKIEIARRAARELVEQFARYADEHPDEPVLLGIYEFSERSGQPDARPIMQMGPPDRARASAALERLRSDGGTPIGGAMIIAKRELDLTGLARRHLLVVTDGDNTDGFAPEQVAAGISRRPEAERPSIYFVAFDIAESRFDAVREAGGLVLSAGSARELNDTLDSLLRGQILIEK